jgi:hypothetical protein
MEVKDIFTAIIFSTLLIISICYIIRIKKTSIFIIRIMDAIFRYNNKCIDEVRFRDILGYSIIPTYNDIFFSYKKLKNSNFISKEYMEKLGLKD